MKRNALLMMVHTQPEQVNLFLKQILYDTDMDIYIHVDKNHESIKTKLVQDPRIKYTKDNVAVTWGGENILMGILLLMKEVALSGIDYHYITFNSGQDLIIQSGVDEFLKKADKRIYGYGFEDDGNRRAFIMHRWTDFYRRRIDFKLHPVKILRRLRLEFYRTFPYFNQKSTNYDTSKLKFYYNDWWVSMPLEVMRYVVDFSDRNPEFVNIYRDGMASEEAFVFTIIMQSQYKDWIKFDNNGKSDALLYQEVSHNGHSTTVRMKDIEKLENSTNHFFSRKFDMNEDPEVVQYFYKKICKGNE